MSERAGAEGWRLVPVEPTEAMLEAARALHDGDRNDLKSSYNQMHREDYRAMLAAAPSPPDAAGESIPADVRIALEKARRMLVVAMRASFAVDDPDFNPDEHDFIQLLDTLLAKYPAGKP